MALAIITETLHYPVGRPHMRLLGIAVCAEIHPGLGDLKTLRELMGDEVYEVAVRCGAIEEIP